VVSLSNQPVEPARRKACPERVEGLPKLAIHGLTPLGRPATVRPGFLSLLGEAHRLTPLATEYRYPGDAHAPEPATAEALLRAAEEIHRVVIASLASKGPNPTAKE